MLSVQDQKIEFQTCKDSLSVMLAQISPAYDPEIFTKEGLVKVKNPNKQAQKILKLIDHALSAEVDVLLFPELTAPFSHLKEFEDALKEADRDLVVNICYEHTRVRELLSILPDAEIEEHGLVSTEQERKLVNFCRVLIKTGPQVKVFTQIKLTPFSSEFSLSAEDSLFCGKILHRFITNWGNFLFLICKDYVGEVRIERRIPMFDFLKTLTEGGLHFVFVSALNTEPEAFIHAARAFYYLQEKSSHTFSLFLNTAELNNTAVVFPVRPHPKIRTAEEIEIVPLFEAKPGWGTQLKFLGCKERVISGTFVRLDKYQAMPTKDIFSPVHQTELLNLYELEIEPEAIAVVDKTVTEQRTLTARTHNLPLQSTPFVGREEELAEIKRLLENPFCRLLTLVGPGGIGKTRLALQAAAEQTDEFPQGVYFVPLAPLPSTDFLVSTVGDFLASPFHGREDPKVQLMNYLREKKMLLVMDNFEHLLEGAGLLTEILEKTSEVKILVTSRERLRLKDERILEVQGMDFPHDGIIDGVENYSAVQLFLQNAQRIRPDFSFREEKSHIVRICQLVEGMPLGIELASGWLKTLSCKDVIKEIGHSIDFLSTSIRDMPERHRSIRAVFEHSWNLLSEQEREVFAKMSVFRGGFRREAAKKVAGATLSHLLTLVDKSLLRWSPSERYEMHDLLRQYAEEKLSEVFQGRERVQDLHCKYYAEFLDKRKEVLRGKKQKEVLKEIGEEIENIREGWDWAVENERKEALDKSLESFFRFYVIRGSFREGEEIFGKAVERLGGVREEAALEKDETFARILARHGVFSATLSAHGKARGLLQRSLDTFRKLNNRKEMGFCLRNLGLVAFRLGEYEEAKKLLRKSLAICTEINDRDGIATSLNSLGHAAYERGEYEQAKQFYEESLSIRMEISDEQGMAKSLINLGNIAHRLGKTMAAKQFYQQSLSISGQIGDQVGMASCLNNLGLVANALGEYEEAQKLYQKSLVLKKDIGDRRGMAVSLGNLGNVANKLGQYEEAKQLHQEMLAICREIGDRQGIAGALHGLAHAACALGEYKESKKYFCEALKTAMGIRLVPVVLGVLVGMATLLANENQKDRALELLILALRHPSAWKDTKDEAEHLYSEIASQVSPQVVAAVRERRQERKLEEIVEEILGEK